VWLQTFHTGLRDGAFSLLRQRKGVQFQWQGPFPRDRACHLKPDAGLSSPSKELRSTSLDGILEDLDEVFRPMRVWLCR